MKRIWFKRLANWSRTEWGEMVVAPSGVLADGVFFGRDETSDPTGHIHLDLDQVEELHRRLGAHLAERGRTPKTVTPAKWRDG